MPLPRRALVIALLAVASILLALPALASAAGNLEANVVSLNFPPTGIHEPPTTQNVTITNGGDESATLSNIVVAAPFSIDPGTSSCDDNPVLGSGGTCNLVVRFAPQVPGPASGNVTLEYDDSVEPRTLPIPAAGEGVTGTLTGGPLNFNSQPYYFGSQQQQIGITNNGSSNAAIVENTTIVGPDAAAFNLNSTCNGALLNPGNTCNFDVRFNPTGPGVFHASLEIQNDGTVNPLVIPFEATALAGPKAVITPDSVDFGTVKVGTVAPSKTVKIANDGDFPLQIEQLFAISGTPTTFPISGDTCSGQEIAPGAECEVTIGFVPTKNGERSASIFVITNTPGPVTIASLTGEGLTAPNGTASLTTQAQVGVPITCLSSGYRNADERSYQWLRGGVAIPGGTQSVYIPVKADVGTSLSCKLTAANAVGTQTLITAPSAAVAANPGIRGPRGKRGAKGKPGKSKKATCKSHHARSGKAARRCGGKHRAGSHRHELRG